MAAALLAAGVLATVPAALGWRYVLHGKPELRDRLLDRVSWRGDEAVLDLGAGTGLLTIGAAHRTTGSVHAVDLFITKDLLGNGEHRLRHNARLEHVEDRLVVHRADVTALPLPDASIDVVLSSLCLHNLPTVERRHTALEEAMRVLRPAGTLVVSDLAHVEQEYAAHLRAHGFTVEVHRERATFPPQHSLRARRTAPSPRRTT